MYEKKCEQCGARYQVEVVSVPFRDSDFIDCQICEAELLRWSGGAIYRAHLIESQSDADSESG